MPLMLSGFEARRPVNDHLRRRVTIRASPRRRCRDPWLMEQMRAQAAHVPARGHRARTCRRASTSPAGPFLQVRCDSGRAVRHRRGNHPGDRREGEMARQCAGEEALSGYRRVGLRDLRQASSFAASKVIVGGGGNSAVEEALCLAQIAASRVTVVHRRATRSRDERVLLQERLFDGAQECERAPESEGRGARRRRGPSRRYRRAAARCLQTGATGGRRGSAWRSSAARHARWRAELVQRPARAEAERLRADRAGLDGDQRPRACSPPANMRPDERCLSAGRWRGGGPRLGRSMAER